MFSKSNLVYQGIFSSWKTQNVVVFEQYLKAQQNQEGFSLETVFRHVLQTLDISSRTCSYSMSCQKIMRCRIFGTWLKIVKSKETLEIHMHPYLMHKKSNDKYRVVGVAKNKVLQFVYLVREIDDRCHKEIPTKHQHQQKKDYDQRYIWEENTQDMLFDFGHQKKV